MTTLCTIALTACGGGSDSGSGGGGSGGGGGGGGGGGDTAATHPYFSLDFEDILKTSTVTIDYSKNTGTVTLGNDTIDYTANDGVVTAPGFTIVGEMEGPENGAMVCKDYSSDVTASRHFILPANAQRVTDLSVLKGKAFERWEDCEIVGEYRFNNDLSVTWTDFYGGEEETGTEGQEAILQWFSEEGVVWEDDDGDSGHDFAQLYYDDATETYYIVELMKIEGNTGLAVAVTMAN